MAVSHATIRFLLSREWCRLRLLRTEVNSGPDGGMGDSRESCLKSARLRTTLNAATCASGVLYHAGAPPPDRARAVSALRLSEKRALKQEVFTSLCVIEVSTIIS